jgi:hypothetical protein
MHPVAIAAVIVLVVNDWLLKPSAAPAWLTGKLSDVAGLVFAPLVLSALIGLVVRAPITIRRLWGVLLATGTVFTVVKLSPDAAHALARAWPGAHASITADPTDLLCLPALAIAAWVGYGVASSRRSTKRELSPE